MKTIQVHKFSMGDVEDPELYAAEPLYKFEISDKGRWVAENAIETPVWYCRTSIENYGYSITVNAKFTDEMATMFLLKWGNK